MKPLALAMGRSHEPGPAISGFSASLGSQPIVLLSIIGIAPKFEQHLSMGAKVFIADATPRSMESATSLLEQLSGQGRVVLTASTATEPAWEIQRFGHGLLTYYLLEALQGAEEVRDAGKIAVYRLLDYVTKRVRD